MRCTCIFVFLRQLNVRPISQSCATNTYMYVQSYLWKIPKTLHMYIERRPSTQLISMNQISYANNTTI